MTSIAHCTLFRVYMGEGNYLILVGPRRKQQRCNNTILRSTLTKHKWQIDHWEIVVGSNGAEARLVTIDASMGLRYTKAVLRLEDYEPLSTNGIKEYCYIGMPLLPCIPLVYSTATKYEVGTNSGWGVIETTLIVISTSTIWLFTRSVPSYADCWYVWLKHLARFYEGADGICLRSKEIFELIFLRIRYYFQYASCHCVKNNPPPYISFRTADNTPPLRGLGESILSSYI